MILQGPDGRGDLVDQVAVVHHGEHSAAIGCQGLLKALARGDVQVVDGLIQQEQVAANQHSLRMVRFGEPNYFYRDLADVLHRNPVLQENHHDG